MIQYNNASHDEVWMGVSDIRKFTAFENMKNLAMKTER